MSKKKGIYKKCIVCNKEYYVPQYRIKSSKYCSKECQNHGQYKGYEKICEGCGKSFYVSNSRIKKKFCSIECKSLKSKTEKEIRKRIKYLNKLKRGNNSSRNLKSSLKKAGIKIECEYCGYNKHEYNIDVHHIDGNPNNNILENLSLLCSIHHRDLHYGGLFYENGKYYESE